MAGGRLSCRSVPDSAASITHPADVIVARNNWACPTTTVSTPHSQTVHNLNGYTLQIQEHGHQGDLRQSVTKCTLLLASGECHMVERSDMVM